MIKFSTGEAVNTVGDVFVGPEFMGGYRRSVATITTEGIDYAEAARLFVDGAVWSIVDDMGTEYDSWNEYTKAGAITDNRDGTLTIKMGMADTSEQVALNEAKEAKDAMYLIAGKRIAVSDAQEVRNKIQRLYDSSDNSANTKIMNVDFATPWELGAFSVGDIRSATVQDTGKQPWKCRQAHDTFVYPDITPSGSAWRTFWIPFHGTTPETALPWVAPTMAEDMYKSGEYMIWTNGRTYRCKSDTNFSPDEYAQAWEVVENG